MPWRAICSINASGKPANHGKPASMATTGLFWAHASTAITAWVGDTARTPFTVNKRECKGRKTGLAVKIPFWQAAKTRQRHRVCHGAVTPLWRDSGQTGRLATAAHQKRRFRQKKPCVQHITRAQLPVRTASCCVATPAQRLPNTRPQPDATPPILHSTAWIDGDITCATAAHGLGCMVTPGTPQTPMQASHQH